MSHTDEALRNIEAALAIIETLRIKIAGQELRSSYYATIQDYYKLYIDLLMRLHKQQPDAGYDGKALQANERSRARSLLELLTEVRVDIRQGVDTKVVERERALQKQLNAKAREQVTLLSGQHADVQATNIAREIENLTTEFQQVETQIRQTSPRYAALTQPQPLTLREIQTQVLDPDTLLLEYSLGQEHSYLWAVTPTSITSYELPKRAEIETVAREFYQFLRTPPLQAASDAEAQGGIGGALQRQADAQSEQTAARLSQMLLAPVGALLGKKRLLIVADGALQYIPFAALPVPAGASSNSVRTPLIVKHEIVSLPSASTLAVLRREAGERKSAPKTLAVLADPVFERTDERFKAGTGRPAVNTNASVGLPNGSHGLSQVAAKSAQESGMAADSLFQRLPASRREADAISALAPPVARLEALDFAANRATATDPVLADYRFVHFATHGFLDSQHPELSGIMLSMFDEEGNPQDGFLRAHEVFNLKLNADVVVLSACQTGLGKDVKGEGLVGLTRGFMYAGTPRVVVSLWSVNDVATAELMTHFYRGMLGNKLRPARALQAAQVSMLSDKRYAAPFYWAAFTLQGEWR
jgi:CHAT domain-containing protein